MTSADVLPQSLLDVRPRIPVDGLAEVARAWNGAGGLYAALAAGAGPAGEWSSRDVERRARRVLLQELEPLLAKWPTNPYDWIDALPAETKRFRRATLAPTAGTNWVETRRAGWPPREFLGREREREADTLLVTTLRWGMEELRQVAADARAVLRGVDEEVRQQIDAGLKLLDVEPVESSEPIRPTETDLEAVRAEGRPWVAFVPVAEAIRRITEATVLELAGRLIVPNQDLSGSLFHLAVFGELLRTLRESGLEIDAIRPLSSAASAGPAYRVLDGEQRSWDLWFEAAGVWAYYGAASPYREATEGVPGAGSSVGADIAMVRYPYEALLIECKSSAHPSRVARDGYHQAVAYLAEIERLVPKALSVVAGSSDLIGAPAFTSLSIGRVGIVAPGHLAHLLEEAGVL